MFRKRNEIQTDVKMIVDSMELRGKISKHIGDMKAEMFTAIGNEDFQQVMCLHNQINALDLCQTLILAIEKPVEVVLKKGD